MQQVLMEFLETHREQPDEGLWEVRGPRRQCKTTRCAHPQSAIEE